jgi:hypothetical protein
MVAGPTSSGKTVLVENILKLHSSTIINFNPSPKIVWCHGQMQERYLNKSFIEYHEGLVDNPSEYDLIVIDDLMNELGTDNRLLNLFTKGSHHMNISVIFIVQNIFHQSKHMRGISLNCQYLIIMKNPRDKSQIHCLARQLYPTKVKKFIKAFEDATKLPYSYLKIDLTPQTPDHLRLQTDILIKNRNHNITVYEL